MIRQAEIGQLLAAKKQLTDTYLSWERRSNLKKVKDRTPNPLHNVVGIGIGEEWKRGRPTGTAAIKIHVRKKFSEFAIPKGHLLPDSVSGIPVDVDEVGDIRPLGIDPHAFIRPAKPGCSIGYQDPNDPSVEMAGTFGALVLASGKVCALSSNHVLAAENQLAPGAPIYQPGLLDSGGVKNTFARLLASVDLKQQPRINVVDCAIAALDNPADATAATIDGMRPAGTIAAASGMSIQKYGLVTQLTVGTVTAIQYDLVIPYDIGELLFENQIVLQTYDGSQFSDDGDSGSLVTERTSGSAVGLLFAGNGGATGYANPIDVVLQALNAALA